MGGWGEIEIKAKLSPAKAGDWAELGNRLKFCAAEAMFCVVELMLSLYYGGGGEGGLGGSYPHFYFYSSTSVNLRLLTEN